jgi:hypothetical protein
MVRKVSPTHTCAQCERRTPAAPNLRNRCWLLRIEDECNEATRSALRTARLWRGERAFAALAEAYNRTAEAIAAAGDEFNSAWPYRTAQYARLVLSARSAAHHEAEERAARDADAKPTVQSVRSALGG